MTPPLEIISSDEGPLAYLVDGSWQPTKSEFLTPDDFGQQMGMIVYPAGGEIIPHMHLPVTRTVEGTSECIVVRKGRCDELTNRGCLNVRSRERSARGFARAFECVAEPTGSAPASPAPDRGGCRRGRGC